MKLKRKLYALSDYVENEKLFFNPLTRAKRIGQKHIGRVRKNIAQKLSDSAQKDLARNKKAISILDKFDNNRKDSLINNKDLTSNLIRDARKDGARIFDRGDSTPKFLNLDKNLDFVKYTKETANDITLPKESRRLASKVSNHADKHKSIILISPQDSVATLAHEMGHQARSISNNPIAKLTSGREKFKKYRIKNGKMTVNSKKYSPINVTKDHVLTMIEEKGASKNGLRKLQELGAKPETIIRSKRLLNVAGETHNSSGKAIVKSSLSDFIQIPSKRVKK